MLKKLTKAQQKVLLDALPGHRKKAVKDHCTACSMRGEGVMDILKSVGGVLGPIVQELGPTVLKEFILPFIMKKMNGEGLSLPGAGLKLAGQGKKRGPGRPRKT